MNSVAVESDEEPTLDEESEEEKDILDSDESETEPEALKILRKMSKRSHHGRWRSLMIYSTWFVAMNIFLKN